MDLMWKVEMNQVTLKGDAFNLEGTFLKQGGKFLDLELMGTDLKSFSLTQLSKPTLIYTIPSLATEVCEKSTLALDQLANKNQALDFLLVSADSSFCLKKLMEEKGVKNLKAFSTIGFEAFGSKAGIRIKNGPLQGLLARSVIAIYQEKVVYSELCQEISSVPDFEKAIDKLTNFQKC